MEREEKITKYKERIMQTVLENREVFENLMKDGGFGWDEGIENNNVLVENVCEQLKDTSENTQGYEVYEEYFGWLFEEDKNEIQHNDSYRPEFYYEDYEIHYGW